MNSTAGFYLEEIIAGEEEQKHFLDACARCHKFLKPNTDVYMYRGNIPFCSEECRSEQIVIDEAAEGSRRRSTAERKNESRSSTTTQSSDQIRRRPGSTVVVN